MTRAARLVTVTLLGLLLTAPAATAQPPITTMDRARAQHPAAGHPCEAARATRSLRVIDCPGSGGLATGTIEGGAISEYHSTYPR